MSGPPILLTGINDEGWPAWYARAACAGMDTEMFFPHGITGSAADQMLRALAVCATCPVCAECRVWAVERGEQGIWGGTNEEARARIRQEQRRAPPRP